MALREGRDPGPARGLGDLVAVPPLREGRRRGLLESVPMVSRLTRDGVVWPDGRGTRAVPAPDVWLVGYGDWTGYASATLIGVGRSARATVDEIAAAFRGPAASESPAVAPTSGAAGGG